MDRESKPKDLDDQYRQLETGTQTPVGRGCGFNPKVEEVSQKQKKQTNKKNFRDPFSSHLSMRFL